MLINCKTLTLQSVRQLTDEENAKVASPNIQPQKAPLLRTVWEGVDVCDEHLHWHIILLSCQTLLKGRSKSTLHLFHPLLCNLKHLHNVMLGREGGGGLHATII